MTYTSIKFIFFVLATALIYFVLPWKKYRWTVLLAASAEIGRASCRERV